MSGGSHSSARVASRSVALVVMKRPCLPPKPVAKATSKSHTLASGETLYRLSAKYGVSVAAIQKANNIKNPNAMREGMKLTIPAK